MSTCIFACPLLSCDKHSLEFTLTHLFMKIFCTASPAVVIECQRSFCLLPITSQIVIRTVKFLQVFLTTDNSLCQLFHGSAVNQSNDILCEYNVRTAGQLACEQSI